jgi:hypothetical protein
LPLPVSVPLLSSIRLSFPAMAPERSLLFVLPATIVFVSVSVPPGLLTIVPPVAPFPSLLPEKVAFSRLADRG